MMPIAACRTARSAEESESSLLASSTHFLRSLNILVDRAANSAEVMTRVLESMFVVDSPVPPCDGVVDRHAGSHRRTKPCIRHSHQQARIQHPAAREVPFGTGHDEQRV